MSPADQIAFVRRYFDLLTAADLDGIVAMFEPDASVLSPFLGKMPAPAFFEKLGDASG